MGSSGRRKILCALGLFVIIVLIAVLVAVFFYAKKDNGVVARATCALVGSMNGTLVLEEFDDGTRVEGLFHEVPFGTHAIHVHEFGSTGNHCEESGGHYNPFNVHHGGPHDEIRHIGDWGNFEVTGIPFMLVFNDPVARLTGDIAIINRSIVIHKGVDDYGRGNTSASKINGNAGPRLACCVIIEA
ncbi:superoxide dismutase [Cu-Zn] 4 [Galendromus occidentalis]|uniref:Superoxide dismutase [Cu-Zn] n=1 Tax=Galendromus occidentalis TaxID=34638 RepID=A0AAJ6VY11_9ACAR|nr:superoxide dismutase [Cu-Zn] 4 [Galendromus occidentalis]